MADKLVRFLESPGFNVMHRAILMLAHLISFYILGCAFYQVTGTEFGYKAEISMINADDKILWRAYYNKSDSLLEVFFKRWEQFTYRDTMRNRRDQLENLSSLLGTVIRDCVNEPGIDEKYFIVQDSIDIAIYDSVTQQTLEDERVDVHSLFPLTNQIEKTKSIILENPHKEIIERFLGPPSEEKEIAAKQFFKTFVSFKRDMNRGPSIWKWFIPTRHWNFVFSPDLSYVRVRESTYQGASFLEYDFKDGGWRRRGSSLPIP